MGVLNMSKLLTIQDRDRERIQHLMEALHFAKQVDVLRAGLELLELEEEKRLRQERWQHAAQLVAKSSQSVNKEFQKLSRLRDSV
jgi:hypothetical protein